MGPRDPAPNKGAAMASEGPVIVTGASTGIGAATTRRLADAGREVISLDIKEAPAAAAATFTLTARAQSRNFDIAIIGAGMFGSAAARHLSGISDGIALIGPAEPVNQRTHNGVFASHYDASRLIRIVDPDLVWGTLAKRSVARFRELEAQSGQKLFKEIGYMMVTPGGLGTDWFNFPAMREVAADLNVEIAELNDGDLSDRFPFLAFTPGSGAMLQAEDAGYIDPRSLVRAQRKLCTAQGATRLDDSVVAIKRRGMQMDIEMKSGESLHANRVLLATGAYTNASGLLQRKLSLKIRAAMIMESEVEPRPVASYPATLYAKTDGEEPFWGLLMPPVLYPDGRTVIKSMDGHYGQQPLQSYEDLGRWMRGNGHVDHHPVLKRALKEVYPSLDVGKQQFKPCLIADTGSGYPYIDMLDDRIGLVAGGNGKAAKSSDEIGRLAAAMIKNGTWESSLPQAVFSARFA